ncbi:hypothetical protein INT46_008563 [Mucor plumbeus]|uniref:Uncharacterized protein n=1 Tax=Mucor plumbeus TaxID=97098 RepID=A0A8H7V5C5_9FUNG|nr:hypothetical protein INT46_008563 [Mucor plumbeus]
MIIDLLITIYYTQYPFYIASLKDINNNTLTTKINESTLIPKKPTLLIDTNVCATNNDSNKSNIQFSKARHNASSLPYNKDYCHHNHTQSAYPDAMPQLLFSSASSVSSFGSYNWSPDENTGKRSKVEDMINLFENGHHYMEQHRRYSVDSYLNCYKKAYIRERKYEYHPMVGEWKKRINGNFPIHLSESKSTPIQRSKRKMIPIMEAK